MEKISLDKPDLDRLDISTQSDLDDYSNAINARRIKEGKPPITVSSKVKLSGPSRLMKDYMNAKNPKQ